MKSVIQRLHRELRGYPAQFWVLTLGIFVFVAGAALAFPFEAIFMHRELGASMAQVGLVLGLVPAAMIPFQLYGGHLTDRLGRRLAMLIAVAVAVVWFAGLSVATEMWQVAALVALESAFGFPLFQTASNAMLADILPAERRGEGYGITRVAMNLGVVLGPAMAALARSAGVSLRQLFLAAAAGCFVMLVLTAIRIHESRPASVHAAHVHGGADGRGGFHVVLGDRMFLVFCAVALLPLFCFGTFGTIYPVFVSDVLGLSDGYWGALFALNALVVVVVQYPLIHGLKARNRMTVLAAASALLAVGVGGSAFAGPLWSLAMLVVVFSLGETLLSPVVSAEVADLAPEAVRGRYMSVWTVVWNGGTAVGPAITGWAMDAWGARQAFMLLLFIGLAGAVAFGVLAPGWRRHAAQRTV